MTVVITGASGTIGTALTQAMRAAGIQVRMLDSRAPDHVPDGAQAIQVDLRDLDATITATARAAAIIHLAGISQEAPFNELCQHNITGTHHVLEAARRNGIARVVLASSHHTVGFHQVGQQVRNGDLVAPDSFYAVSKVAAEALGSLYSHKFGIQVVVVRIGSFRQRPAEPRHAATWLSPGDGTTLLTAAATTPLRHPFLLVYGTSDNPQRWWHRDGWDELGYRPADRADDHDPNGPVTDRWHGGPYAEDPGPL